MSRPAGGALVKQPHGGAIRNGQAPGAIVGGYQKSKIRQAAREVIETQLVPMYEQAISHGTTQIGESVEPISFKDKLEAAKQLASLSGMSFEQAQAPANQINQVNHTTVTTVDV